MRKPTLVITIFITMIIGFAMYLFTGERVRRQHALYTNGGEFVLVDSKEELIQRRREEHAKATKAIDNAWNNISVGNSYYRLGQYEKAAEAYKKAYLIGERAVSGFKLVETYEKLGRYDQGIELLNEMMNTLHLNEVSTQDAQELKSRLLAKKEKSNDT